MTIWYKVHWAYIIACVSPRMLRTAMHFGQFIGLGAPPPVWKICWVKPSSVSRASTYSNVIYSVLDFIMGSIELWIITYHQHIYI